MTDSQHDSIYKRIDRLKDELVQLCGSTHGNGCEGLGSRIAVLESRRGGMSRFVWMIAGAVLSTVSSIVALSVVGLL